MLHSDVVGYQCFIGPPSTLHPEVYLETTRSSETGITTQRTATQIFITMKTSSPALGLNLANFNSVTVFMTMLLKNTVFQHNSQVYHCSDSSWQLPSAKTMPTLKPSILGGAMWTESIWLRTRTSGGPLWTQSWTSGFHKRQGIFWLAQWLLASQEGLCSMELLSFEVKLKNPMEPKIMLTSSGAWCYLRACASDRAHSRRYEAVWDTDPSTYSIVWIPWWMNSSPMSCSSSSLCGGNGGGIWPWPNAASASPFSEPTAWLWWLLFNYKNDNINIYETILLCGILTWMDKVADL